MPSMLNRSLGAAPLAVLVLLAFLLLGLGACGSEDKGEGEATPAPPMVPTPGVPPKPMPLSGEVTLYDDQDCMGTESPCVGCEIRATNLQTNEVYTGMTKATGSFSVSVPVTSTMPYSYEIRALPPALGGFETCEAAPFDANPITKSLEADTTPPVFDFGFRERLP